MRYLRHEGKETDQNDYSSIDHHSGSEDRCQYLSVFTISKEDGVWT